MSKTRMSDGEFAVFQMIWTVVLVLGCAVIGCRDRDRNRAAEGAVADAEVADARAEKRYLVYRDELDAATNTVIESSVQKADVPVLGSDPTFGEIIDAVNSMGGNE